MPEPRPGEQPGHLDIDAVSAFVDRDFEIAELTILEQHLHECPACNREVLEIRATVLLLNTLPLYEPRRSFCLGQEHARAHRRRDRQQHAAYLPGSNPLTLPASTPPDPITAPAYARWMPGLQVATLVTGVLLLLVTVGDLSGMLGSQSAPMQLAAPVVQDAAPQAPMAAVPQEQEQEQEQASESIPLLTATAAPAAAAPADAPQAASGFTQGGTNSADDASDQVSESDEAPLAAARAIPTSAAAAAVTQAIPTPGVENPAVSTNTGATGSESAGIGNGRPSLVRIAQIALAALLLWLVVSMAGVQWIRRLR